MFCISNMVESTVVLKRGTWVTLTGGRGTLMPPPTDREANLSCRSATCRGVEMSPDWMRPEKASWDTDMVEPEMPEGVELVMDTEPEPCTPAVEAVTMVGGEV